MCGLSAAIACLFGMFALNKLPQWYHSLFRSERFKKVTDDKFLLQLRLQIQNFIQKKPWNF